MDFLTGIPRKWIGAIIGVLIALLMIWFGFWKLIFILFCAGIGYLIGRYLDGDQSFDQLFQRLFPSR